MAEPIDAAEPSDGGADGVDPQAIVARIVDCLQAVSSGWDRWDEDHARGPGLYFVVERTAADDSVAPMGTNRWPVEDCQSVFAAPNVFRETARSVAQTCDGAVLVHADGTIDGQMVRVKQLRPSERAAGRDLSFAGWMGARHMSALETSTRSSVDATITLSEEDGRVTVFTDGRYEEIAPSALATD